MPTPSHDPDNAMTGNMLARAALRPGKKLGGRSSAWLRRQYAGRSDAAAAP